MKTSTAIAVVAALVVVVGGLWYYSSTHPVVPADEAGLNGSPDQGNLGGSDNGLPQMPDNASFILHTETNADSELGTYLVALNGMTLYRFTQDAPHDSNCTGQCLVNWPPYTVPTAEDAFNTSAPDVGGEVGTIVLPDGSVQVTYNEMPLYYFAGDNLPGDTLGQGVNAQWFVVAP